MRIVPIIFRTNPSYRVDYLSRITSELYGIKSSYDSGHMYDISRYLGGKWEVEVEYYDLDFDGTKGIIIQYIR